VYEYFVGTEPDDGLRASLAADFVASGHEIRPLVEAVIRHPSFLEHRLNRPRNGVEWISATQGFLGVSFDQWQFDQLGQTPLVPPNVAGWPGQRRWVSAGATFAKAQMAWDNSWDTPTLESDDPVSEWKASLHEVSDITRNAMYAAIDSVEGRREQSTVLHALVACCPEFNLA
jgi:uncharacterized protein (DUF1800 family)